MKQEISNILKQIFNENGYNIEEVIISKSNRPDLCDFQCNDIFKLAKIHKTNPVELGEEIVKTINEYDDFNKYFKEVTFCKPGFINIKVSNELINKYIKILEQDEKQLLEKTPQETFVLDYGGPNVAKPLHVGHMRTAIIGESIKRIINYMGHKTISDVHLGDYGLQIGEVIYGMIRDGIKIEDLDIKYLDKIYPEMNAICKENKEIKEECENIIKKIQDDDPFYMPYFNKVREVSIPDIKKNYDYLDVKFDLWLGESDSKESLADVEKVFNSKNLLETSDGAQIINVKEDSDKKEIPPLLFKKSNGGYLYASTDLATIYERVEKYNPDHILYVVDNRQELHFTQVFRTVEKAGIMPKEKLEFLGYGTVNGTDNKPYKTRTGNSPKLEALFEDARNIFISKKESNKDMSLEDVNKIVNAILKFADLSNSRTKDYIFDLNKFSDVTGKTGPYILYTYLRINKILETQNKNLELSNNIYNEPDRDLRLKLLEMSEAVNLAFKERMPHYIADYVYNLCVSANVFYQNNHIMNIEDEIKKNDWLYVLTQTNKIIKQMLNLLVIDIPSVM